MRSGRPRGFEQQEALDAAVKMFWERGFEETSMADLERCLGLGRQSIYNVLGDKRRLFLAALRRYGERYTQPQIDALLDAPTPAEGLRRWVDGWLLGSPGHTLGCLIANTMASPAAGDPEIQAALDDQIARLKDALERTLRGAQQESKRSPALDTTAMAEVLVALHHGRTVLGRVLTPDVKALRRAVDYLLESVC